ncbi:hypothetical protein GCM10011609_06680 [Lentzea pudingi]|uniref:Tetratricopeptide repeat-containing protein n=2 Tax=Lentzea pudingi TaxID=1789439 RepID=A0ABQ2HDY6_9PSEU|nr:hypothetical protein GCM10011609_06680 [Lentzea pudingi]
MWLAEGRVPGAVEVDVATGPGASYDGLRRALQALRASGATFGDLPGSRPAEWAELFPAEADGPALQDVALAPSERRLHRESEQVYRVLTVAAAALCTGAAELGSPLLLTGLAGTDLSSLRGFMRAAEHAATSPGAQLLVSPRFGVGEPPGADADYRAEKVRCLNRMGLPIGLTDLVPDPNARHTPPEVFTPEADLYARAMGDGSAADRVSAALTYCRLAFFSSNWEGMASVAVSSLALLPGLEETAVEKIVTAARDSDDLAAAIEFEPGIVRSLADVRAFLLKVLGIQASFRGDQAAALAHFAAMRESGEKLSPELRAQAHLYRALTLSKRSGDLVEASAELDAGFAAVAARPDESDSVRRERGWLHNLRGLTFFAQKRLKSAFEQEKLALECLAGLTDSSSAHLRINLYSNISVLQEKSGRAEQALATWEKFSQASGSSEPAFRKHHAYRSAGLRLLVGEATAALDDLAVTLECARFGRDDFHECEVRLELGGLHTDRGESERALEHYRAAEDAARRLADPLRIAQAKAGRAVVTGDSSGTEDVVRFARISTSSPAKAAALADAASDTRAMAAVLPRPRTKLNRPFDAVNFQDGP